MPDRDRSNKYTNAAIGGAGVAGVGGLGVAAGRAVRQGAKDTTAQAYGAKLAARRREGVILANPNLPRTRGGEPDYRFGEGKGLKQARVDMVEADAKRVVARRQFGVGRKIATGGKVVAAAGGLAALAAGAMSERARWRARNPKQEKVISDAQAKGTEKRKRLAGLTPAKRPQGGYRDEDVVADPETGKYSIRDTSRRRTFNDWQSSGMSAEKWQRARDLAERRRQQDVEFEHEYGWAQQPIKVVR